jgi:hypothetical protein
MTRTEALSLIGEIAAQFSSLDFVVTNCLLNLVDIRLPLVGGITVNDLTWSKKIQLVQQLAVLRYVRTPHVAEAINDAMVAVDKMRVRRNSFIHGMWHVEDALLSQGKVMCLSQKWVLPKLKDKDKSWKTLVSEDWTLAKLTNLRDEIGVLFGRVHGILQLINQTPMWEGMPSKPAKK